ncbi:hypothetical protein F442_14960 [Phytophthora nicotianae P10297]|uniref:Uncharacterized protein n=1 Tax=Phytophthora nicotianae P10297 TaxID=1317064 RepID=W2YQL4_PHYNI|nr:hypothetical protein F442_14960 [Phytophthora nicotianae P10297]
MDVPEGVYVCAGHPYPLRLGHCFLLKVTAHGAFASDADICCGSLRVYGVSWLAGSLFIRRVKLRE